MTSSGKIRIYELSKDLSLDNKDVLDAARKLAIAAKSHSSSISNLEANQIKDFLKKSSNVQSTKKPTQKLGKEILSVNKSPSKTQKDQKQDNSTSSVHTKSKLNVPLKPKQTLIKTKDYTSSNNPQLLKNKVTEKEISLSSKPNKPLPPKPRKEIKPIISSSIDKIDKELRLANPNKDIDSKNNTKDSQSTNKPINKDHLTNRPEPKRPLAPPSRPKINYLEKKQSPTNKPKPRFNQSSIPSQKAGLSNSQLRKNQTPKVPQPPKRGNTLELVGAPIRREKPVNKTPTNDITKKPLIPTRPGDPNQRGSSNRQGLPNRQGTNNRVAGQNRPIPLNRQGHNRGGSPNRPNQAQNRPGGQNRAGGPTRPGIQNRGGGPNRAGFQSRSVGNPNRSNNRPGVPSGMRKPVAPSELMQLQKPQARPNAPQRRSDTSNGPKPKRENSAGVRPPVNRPTPAAPKKPAHNRPGGGATAPRRTGRPDWDDSAKLDALRNKSPQKQRQKVHIIGENDDALTAETSGFAGGQQAVVLSASLARPSKPKSGKKNNSKPLTALKKRKKETTRQRQRRRAMELRAAREAKLVRPEMIVVPEDNLTVQELADMLSVESSEIIKSLFFKGITATVTQSLDLATIETVAEEFGVPVLQDDVEEAAKKQVK